MQDRECGYCGVKQGQVQQPFELDHFVPKRLGGTDHNSNRVWACHYCNQAKGGTQFRTIEDAREFLHWMLWGKNRQRYMVYRTLCFGGKPPEGMPVGNPALARFALRRFRLKQEQAFAESAK